MPRPPEIYVFDAFGTLFDVHAAVRQNAEAIGEKATWLSELWRAKQLEYTWFYAGRGTYMPFRGITRDSLLYALDALQLTHDLALPLLESYQRLEPFPEVAECLRTLKARGARLAILSNADPDMLDDLIEAAQFRDFIEYLITVAVAGTFKPAPNVYALAVEVFAMPASDMTFVSSNRWDVAGAKASGFQTVWVNRGGTPDEYLDYAADQIFKDIVPLTHSRKRV